MECSRKNEDSTAIEEQLTERTGSANNNQGSTQPKKARDNDTTTKPSKAKKTLGRLLRRRGKEGRVGQTGMYNRKRKLRLAVVFRIYSGDRHV